MTDVVIVGAGIVGAACAYELAQAGATVELLDPNIPGSGGVGTGYDVRFDNRGHIARIGLNYKL